MSSKQALQIDRLFWRWLLLCLLLWQGGLHPQESVMNPEQTGLDQASRREFEPRPDTTSALRANHRVHGSRTLSSDAVSLSDISGAACRLRYPFHPPLPSRTPMISPYRPAESAVHRWIRKPHQQGVERLEARPMRSQGEGIGIPAGEPPARTAAIIAARTLCRVITSLRS